jgi:methanogenic corrinoid protein MtbC1
MADAMVRGNLPEAADLAGLFLGRTGCRLAVYSDLVQPAQREISELWYRGQISIEDEQRAAGVLELLLPLLPPTPGRTRVPAGNRCLLSVLPGERHTLGLAMFAHVLEDEGWEVELMDHDCQPQDLTDLVDRTRPRLVCLSAGHVPSVPRVAQAIRAIRALNVPVLVGGSAFNRTADLWRRVGASAYGPDPRTGTVLARRLVRS